MIAASVRVLLLLTVLAGAIACSAREESDDRSPQLDGPASRYIPDVVAMHSFLRPNTTETYEINRDLVAYLGPFSNATTADEFLRTHGFDSGYRSDFRPEGQLAGVAGGGQHYLTIEAFLFTTAAGAEGMLERYETAYDATVDSERVEAESVGNQSSAWQMLRGTVGQSDVVAAYHRFVFQRGNMVAVIQTFGAADEVSIDVAREVAEAIDARAMGDTAATEATPVADSQPPTPGED